MAPNLIQPAAHRLDGGLGEARTTKVDDDAKPYKLIVFGAIDVTKTF